MRIDRPADPLLSAAVRHVERQRGAAFPDGYRSEVLPQLPYWMQAVVGGLEAGALLFVDYGHPRREYYAPDRNDGTLRAFHRHRVSNDVYANTGLQDITASVDFTALAEAGTDAGFDFAGYCSQASLLIGNGLEQRLAEQEARAGDEAARYALRQQAKQLTLPGAMGERFQAMGFSRGVEFDAAFARRRPEFPLVTAHARTQAAATSAPVAVAVVAGGGAGVRGLPGAGAGPADGRRRAATRSNISSPTSCSRRAPCSSTRAGACCGASRSGWSCSAS